MKQKSQFNVFPLLALIVSLLCSVLAYYYYPLSLFSSQGLNGAIIVIFFASLAILLVYVLGLVFNWRKISAFGLIIYLAALTASSLMLASENHSVLTDYGVFVMILEIITAATAALLAIVRLITLLRVKQHPRNLLALASLTSFFGGLLLLIVGFLCFSKILYATDLSYALSAVFIWSAIGGGLLFIGLSSHKDANSEKSSV